MKKNLRLSIATAAAIASMSVFTGCGLDDGTTSSSGSTTTTVSGTAVDGYIKDANVSFGTASATTDVNGSWSLVIANSAFGVSSNYITLTGGTDTATGEAFEGNLTAIVPDSTSSNTGAVITPLTSVVQQYVANNSGTTESSARTALANVFGISETAFTIDPVSSVDNNDSNLANAQAALKAIMQVQKFAEVMADANVSNPMNVIASQAKTTSDSNSTAGLDAVLTAVAEGSSITDANVSTALKLVKNQINEINASEITSITELKQKAKVVEVISSAVETALNENNVSKAADVAKAAAVNGFKKLETLIETQTSNAGNDIDNVDASTIATSFFTDSLISSGADTYQKIVDIFGESNSTAIDQAISNIADSNETNTTALIYNAVTSVKSDVNTTDLNNSLATFVSDLNTSENNVSTQVASTAFQAFTISGGDANVSKSGVITPSPVSISTLDYSATYNNFAQRIENNASNVTFFIELTNSSNKVVNINVSPVTITKYSDSNSTVNVGTDAKLTIQYTQNGVLTTISDSVQSNTADIFDTNSTGSMDVNLTSKVNVIRADSAYSDFNSTISSYESASDTYNIKACFSTELQLDDYYDSNTTGYRCITGKISK